MSSLKNQIAVVTGAGSGIGKSIALSLACEGAKVCIVGRNLEKLQAVADSARQFSGSISTYQADLEIDQEINNLATSIQKKLGGIDILIHSAGTITIDRIDRAAIEDFDRQYRVNVRAPYLLTQAFLPTLKVRRGQIVFINSNAGLTAKAGISQYAATKHALKAVADSLREEINPDRVRVLTVFPGRTAGPLQEALQAHENRVYQPERLIQPEDVASVIINSLNLPRTAEVTDINIRPLIKL